MGEIDNKFVTSETYHVVYDSDDALRKNKAR